jgi:hypothetical protein
MTLQELIAFLECQDPDLVVPLGFGSPHSYRGFYSELAFEPAADVTVRAMLEAAQSALGRSYEGWKGGSYIMDAGTPCWLAWEGNSGDQSLGVVLMTFMMTAVQLPRPVQDALRALGARVHF